MRTVKNRKTHNKEIERQKKQRGRLIATVSVFTLALVIAAISWVVWDTHSRGWILQFEGQRIPTNEMRFFMEDESPQGKQAALDTLLEHLTVLDRADRHNVNITDDERDMWEGFAQMLSEGQLMPISVERFGEFLAASLAFSEVRERLMDIYIPIYQIVVDEASLLAEFDAYFAENILNYLETDVKYVIIEDAEVAEHYRALFLAGEMEIDDIIRAHAPEHLEDPNDSIVVMALGDLMQEAMLDENQQAALMALAVGEISEVIHWGAEMGFHSNLMVYVVRHDEPDESHAFNQFRVRHIEEVRAQQLVDLVTQWRNQANYNVNQRAFDLA